MLTPSPHINPAILGPSGFIIACGIQFTARTRDDFRGRHSMIHDDVFDAVGTLSAQRQIVAVITPQIGVPNELHGVPLEFASRETGANGLSASARLVYGPHANTQ